MKTLLKLSLASLCFVLTSFNSRDSYISFEQALTDKKIKMEILPYGTYDEDGIKIEVENLTNRPLYLKMAKGTIFIPDADPEQTLIKSEDELLVLDKNQKKSFQFIGYCTELHDHGPDDSTIFQMAKSQNTALVNLLSLMDSLKIKDENAIQHSIWCITDSSSVSNVGTQSIAATKALRNYLCSVTGQKDTWYNTNAAITETPEHVMVIIPKEIKGELTFTTTEHVELQGVVKDSSGKVLVTNPNKTTCPPGKISFEFKLKIEGWKPGNYFVVYTNNGVEVINQPFTI